MNIGRIVLLAITATLLASDSADGCQRCGLFGRLCRFQSVQHHHVAVAPVAAYQQPNVFVVQNNYPQPLAQQGATQYGYQASASAYLVNPAEVLRQAAELSKAATATASIGISGFNQTAQTTLALQASITEPLARGQAAAQVLTAAGFTQTSSQPQSMALRIYRTAEGQWRVEQAESAEINATVNASVGNTPPPPPRPESGATSVIQAKCSRCHGLSMTEPKGGIFLDAGHQLDCATVIKSLRLIKSGKMPKDGTLTNEEKGLIFDELLSLEREGGT